MYVIGKAGFGMRMGWQDEESKPQGYAMTSKVLFQTSDPREYSPIRQEALHSTTAGIFVAAVTPTWLMKLAPTRHLRQVKLAYEELKV